MQIPKTVVALTSLIPHSKTLLALARKCRFVLRTPRKIWPDQILRAVLVAICEGTPHFRAIAENLSADSDEPPSRQAVFERLKHEAAPAFFFSAFRQVLQQQCLRFARRGNSGFDRAIGAARGIFGRVIIEDGSVLPLHKSLADRFEGSLNQYGHCAALRLRWAFDFLSGETIDAQLHEWLENDMSTAFDLMEHLKSGDLVLRDMGYFCLQGFREIARLGAWFLTRIPEGTVICDQQGAEISLAKILRKVRGARAVVERIVKIGRANPLEGRLVAVKIDPEKAAQRRRKLREKLRAQSKVARRDQLVMCDWVVVFTNVEAERMDAQSIAELYRARWMVEIFFKGMKSGQDLEKWSRHRTNENTIQCLAYAQMIIGVLTLNLWRMMGRIVNFADQSDASASERHESHPHECGEAADLRTIGPLKALESLIPLLTKVFSRALPGRCLMDEISRLARYAVQEKRNRLSLDQRIFGLLT